MNCIAVIAPRKNTVGTASACTANQRTVKIGYVNDLFVVMNFKKIVQAFYGTSVSTCSAALKRSVIRGIP